MNNIVNENKDIKLCARLWYRVRDSTRPYKSNERNLYKMVRPFLNEKSTSLIRRA